MTYYMTEYLRFSLSANAQTVLIDVLREPLVFSSY